MAIGALKAAHALVTSIHGHTDNGHARRPARRLEALEAFALGIVAGRIDEDHGVAATCRQQVLCRQPPVVPEVDVHA